MFLEKDIRIAQQIFSFLDETQLWFPILSRSRTAVGAN